MIRSGKQTGYILLPVIVVITLVAAIALLMNTESALESNTAGSELDAQQAQYVAEAGLNHALWLNRQQGCGPYSDLTDEPLGNDKYTSNLTTDLGSTTGYSSTVDQDTWIKSNQPDVNKGSDGVLHVGFVGGDSERPLLRFDLSSIPAKAAILSATAWFYADQPHPEGPVDIHRITADWLEIDATWNTMNANMDSAVIASIPPQPTIGVWVPVNLTSQVQAWINGQSNYGITLNSTSEGVDGRYDSRESANAPYLEVVVGTPPTSPALLKAVGNLDNGVNRNISRYDVVLYQHPTGMRQLQPGAVDGEDAEIWDQAPNNNYGAAAETWVSSAASDTTRSLLRFNMGAVPAGARILQANLSLERQSGSGADQPVSAHRIMNPWSEDSVTWNDRETGTNWDTAGADFDNTAVATTPVGPLNQRYAWNITSLVQGWVDGSYPNYGVALVAAIAGMPGERFYTSDHADPTLHPRLTVSYSCSCGEICVAPQSSGNLLMAVINPTTLVAEDQKAKDLFESWGYTVSVIGESANQTSYDAAVAINDVVFISETVNSNAVGTKLKNAPIGVVSQDGDYNPDLGFSESSALTVGNAIDIVSTDHFITQPFAIGPLEIYSASMEQLTVAGDQSGDLNILAESSGDGSLVVLDTGDALEDGGNAAGRRVMLPLGTRYRFNWDYLNANGRLLVQRALDWAIGDKKPVTNEPIILSTASSATLGGLTFTDKDLAEYDPDADNATLYLDGIALGLAQDIDAVHVLTNGHIVLSAINTITLGGITSENEDLIDYDPVADSATLMFDGSALFTSGSTDISAVHVLDNGHLLLTNEYTATLGGLSFGPNDIVDYDPVANSATLFFDGDAVGFSGWINAVHLLGNGHIVLSTDLAATLGGINLEPGDLADYDPVADSATLFLDGDLFSAAENVRSAHVGPGSGGDAAPDPFKVLFVVGNVGGPGMTAEEIAHQTLIESWGHAVEIIDDGASQTDFDTAVANNDVVFITNDITASTLGTKLVNATIGVVTSEDNLSDEFGLASAIAWESGTQVEINDNTHYITSPFVTGLLPILTASESLAYVTGTLSPDLGLLASSASGYGVVTLETGDALFGGGSAAGRRAQLPWGGNGFDPGNLNADGLQILKRALEWGAGAGADTGPLAHWKLDETSGFNAEDSASDNDGTLPAGNDWIPGIIDGGLDFDGSNDYVDVGTFDVSGSGITMMGWFNAEAIATDDGRIVSKANGPNAGDAWWQLSTTDSGSNRYLRMRIKAGGTTTTMADSTVNLSTSQWYFAVGTYSNATGEMKLYLNGSEIRSGSHALGGSVDTDAAVPVAIGANGTAERFFNGILDDVRVYDYALGASEIADLYADNSPPPPPGYIETYAPWSAPNNDTWEVVDLGAFGVPANAVVEVAVVNARVDRQFWGGVREVGSTLDRRLQLHEAEAGGTDVMVMTVQANALAQIEHYSDTPADVTFILLGYWTVGSFVEAWDFFNAGASNSWRDHSLSGYGVTPASVAEILVHNDATGNNYLGGARSDGSTVQRRFGIHEPEGGGKDMVTLMVNAGSDAGATIEVFAQSDSGIDFYLMGYWSTPPGTYTETGGNHGQVTAAATWEPIDLTSYGVPADTVAQFVLTNEADTSENQMGVRATGSIQNRLLDLQEAEAGGSDLGSMHVNVDATSQVEWYAESGGAERLFYPVGWWVLSP